MPARFLPGAMSIFSGLDRRLSGRRRWCPRLLRREAMPDFILLLHQLPGAPLPPEAMATAIKEYGGWRERMRGEGRLKAGQKLTNDAGRNMRTAAGGRVVVTDGPYAESKELLGGFFVVTAKDYDDACQMAESCPHLRYGGRIEIRQIDVV
jgi:hypothetical protein